ncbi:TPA: hypothetical protein DCZ15_03135 [Candidatus Falkowbacteria bacterium]|nr:MAG: hypothetical protein UV95_C0002G0013 [Candidatus Falkowbacteria bacterium GW2011_GWF2_43_32]HBA36843.1 hypothetical protein [Candidatus Falkowbacteria bacterium]
MKTKKLIKLTPLFNSIIQSVVITAIILLVIIIKESWPIIIAAPFAAGYLYFIVIGLFLGDECYDESIYGVCRYRIIKERILDSDLYFIQAKPLSPFFFLFWKGAAHSSFLYKKDGELYMCDNAFRSKEDAYWKVKDLTNRQEYKKLFLVKEIEICSHN